MVDKDVFINKSKYVRQYIDDLKQNRDISKQEYLDDEWHQRAVERTLQNLIQASIDLAQHIRSSEDLPSDGTGRGEMQALGEAGIISDETRAAMEDVRFRNILAHRYGDVDDEIVYSVQHNNLHYFEQFQQEVSRWFEQHAV